MESPYKVLVTGGCGFIGSHLVDELLNNGYETYVIDNLSSGRVTNLEAHKKNSMLHIINKDISQINEVSKDLKDVDAIFHQAAIPSVTSSIKNPKLVFKNNVASTMEMLDFSLKSNVKRIIFASSSAVYGDVQNSILTEDLTCRPTSPYGASKLTVENYLHSYWKSYGVESISLRYFNVYGPRQSNNDYSGVITIFANRILNNLSPVIYGNGLQVRDFVNIKDVVKANMLSMVTKTATADVLNIGTGIPTNILNLVEITKNAANKMEIAPTFADPRIGDNGRNLASICKAQNLLGYNPDITLQQGIESLLNSYQLI